MKGDRLVANGERGGEGRGGEATLHCLLALWRGDLQKAMPWRQRQEATKALPFVFSLKKGDRYRVLKVKGNFKVFD